MARADESDSLGDYRGKRDFTRTPEPEGGVSGNKGAGVFVVQKHSSRTLHYDLRLELHGVLKSWAVPKGPSINPDDKRLAVRVEDHPAEYAAFEGVIPRGEYGGGAVLLWDRGFWIPEENPVEGLRKGALKFILSGRKLKGRWALVRMGGGPGEDKEDWLLIKEQDEEASKDGEITAEMPKSVDSDRTVEDVAALPQGIWSGAKEHRQILPASTRPVKAPMPPAIRPELATQIDTPPAGEDWLHEIKYDGYRILARVERGRVGLITRNGNDWTARFPTIAKALSRLPLEEGWLDGEVVSIDKDGSTSFEGLQHALAEGSDTGLIYIIFDALYYNGYSLEGSPTIDRKLLVQSLLRSVKADRSILRFSEHIEGNGEAFFENACGYRVEGIISKRRDAPYVQGRTSSWVKVKCLERQEFVIGGFTEPGGGRKGFGALLIGVFDAAGRFIYSGRVGTGFNERSITEIWKRLKEIEEPGPAFHNPPAGAEAKGVHWVRPELVAEVEYTQWTRDGVLRHPSFQGLREDKSAQEVVHEEPRRLTEAIGPAEEGLAATPPPEPGPGRLIKAVRVTNPERVFYPEDGFTKRDLIEYYEEAAPLMLPHLIGRPLTLVRCPEGYDKECFFQKHTDQNIPPEIKRVKVTENDGTPAEYLMVDSPEGIIALVQLGVLEVHTWNSRYVKIESPDRIVFDIDPDAGVEWARLVEAVYLIRDLLVELGLKSFVKSTGGKGLHVVVPLEPILDWDEVKAFSKAVAELISSGLPGRFTSMMTKSRRAGKIFIDYMRNIRGATAIEACSTRAKKGAPVASPLTWDELMRVGPGSFTLANIRERIRDTKDPWQGYFDIRQAITEEMKEKVSR
ncbi:MAG TPA: DNA ligase D [Deltaproteobacteria bacterium]|nr:MAG: hypothetical protein A2Z79_02200 [Deltaproteobacteria bacterium GWA2_55_82]OGQ62636.1 MAG: hypothetical protein A3I81_09015 [Deltaproteobacteria bacterium RIFCSPLOWO2_02_FULL_55_12]OIJ74228.1 MAG: hypothetical protein A2V21_308100 [Deltaproteobacteria bacterium GWC2_55_46]HBG46852.1 DNA ligase D [Deltaproteobacteria bacterium]HCY11090.1 DNA ligase D [Deltaproteobacteria bacterium]